MRQEAQAIVLAAGPGSRMTAVNYRAKCLLPIGNHPMIYYPLKFLEDAGFDEATIIVSQSEEREIKKLNEVFGLKLRLDIAPLDTSDDPGTAESLKMIENKIKKNVDEVVVISSDLLTDASLSNMMNFHRSMGAALTILTVDQNPEFSKALPPGPKTKPNINKDILCTDGPNRRLVFSVAAGDYDDYICLSRKILSDMEDGIDLATDVLDAHLYIMKKELVDYILHKDSPCAMMGSLKAEVIPRIISEQFTKVNGVEIFLKKDKFEDLIRKHNTSSVLSRLQPNSKLDCRASYAFHHSGFCVRINTMSNLWQVNRKINELGELLKVKTLKYVKGVSEEINERAQVCDECVIGRSTQIAEKTNITNSVLGNHNRINSFVRISNSVLFDYVIVEQGCVIENCLICVSVEKKCILKNCILTDSSKIMENGIYENELLEKGLSQD